jgi:hypothetical protein
MPLDQISGGGDRDDDAGPRVSTDSPADELARGLGGGPPQLRRQLAPSAEERTQQAGNGQDDMAVAARGEHFVAQPLRPQNLALLLARRAAIAAAIDQGRELLASRHHPDGFNIGVNVGEAAARPSSTCTSTSSRATAAT